MFRQCDKMCLLTFIIFVVIESFSVNTTAQLISTYAKVAHWGAGKTSENEGRSRGQTLWTQRSEANIRENPKKPSTRYHYSMKVPSSKLDYSTLDEIPAKGEVQERYNPRPYFDFVFDNNPNPNKKPKQNKPDVSSLQPKPPNIVYASPMNSKPPPDSYNSPFTSYNPPQFISNNFQNTPPELLNFPPYNNPNLNFSISKPPVPPKEIYQLPPPALSGYDNPSDKPTPDMQKLPPDDDKYSDSFHPPLVAPEFDQHPIFVPQPPEDGDAPMEDHKDDEKNEHDNNPPPPEETSYLEHPPPDYDYHYHHSPKPPSMAEQDLSPPPSGIQFPKIPQYLDHKPDEHDFYHFNHHDVYHEDHVTTAVSTTTSAPRAGHYSYYYLGRKLWYIPLYFSVYFIIYVTILILKSIARHKIQFSHNFDKSRSFSELDDDYVNSTVVDAIENANNKFM